MRNLFSDTHITPEGMLLLISGGADADERLALSEHIALCTRCADRLSEALVLSAGQLPAPPASFAEDTLYALRPYQTQSAPVLSKKQYAFYCMRVGLAVCASLALVFSGAFDRFSTIPAAGKISESVAFTEHLSDSMKNFSDKLINLEVLPHDKQAQ